MEVKQGYKHTVIGVFPEDWEIIPLKQISSMHGRIGWQGLKQSEFTMVPDDPFLITGMNFKDGEIRWEEVYHVSWVRYEIAKEIQLKIGDVLMTKDGTIGKILYVDEIPYPGKATLNSHLLVFRPLNNRYIPKFLFYQLNSKTFHIHIEQEKSGSTFFGITQEAVGKYNAYIPPLSEQRAIAAALSDVDALLAALDVLIAKKRLIKQGTMQELLTGKRRFPGFSAEWQVKELQEIANQFIVPMRDKPKSFKGSIPWCRIEDFDGKYLLDSKSGQYVDDEIIKSMNLRIHPEGTLLVSCSADLGRCAIVNKPLVTNQTFIGLVFDEHKASNEFFYYYMTNNAQELNNLSTGTTIGYLSREQFETFKVKAPTTKKEQQAIAEILSDIDTEIAALEQKREKIHLLKQGMMQELLTGRIRLI